MFSFPRKRLRVSPATVIAIVALVLAMTGGAYAAGRYVITSAKQIKPSVLKALKGNAGAAGKAGAPGTAGTAGSQGPEGKQGGEGHEGKQGPEGKQGLEGKQGEKGVTGSPWTAGGTLPKGATETGTWGAAAHEGLEVAALTFQIPLTSPLDGAHVHYLTLEEVAGGAVSQCPGSSAAPTAVEGNLCVYEAELSNPNNGVTPALSGVHDPHTTGFGAGVAGAALQLATTEPEAIIWGSYAVTG